MRLIPIPILLVFLLSMTGCDQADTSTLWQATLTGQPGFESVSGTSTVNVEGGQTVATTSIQGATPGAAHPWHIHIGSCATDGPIFGEITGYPDLNVASDGTASASATVGAPLSTNHSYFVNVHASPQDLATIVACGDLTRSGGSSSPPPTGNGGPPY